MILRCCGVHPEWTLQPIVSVYYNGVQGLNDASPKPAHFHNRGVHGHKLCVRVEYPYSVLYEFRVLGNRRMGSVCIVPPEFFDDSPDR